MRGLFDTNRKKNYIEWDENIFKPKKRDLLMKREKYAWLYENKQLVSCFVFITRINFYTKRDVKKTETDSTYNIYTRSSLVK